MQKRCSLENVRKHMARFIPKKLTYHHYQPCRLSSSVAHATYSFCIFLIPDNVEKTFPVTNRPSGGSLSNVAPGGQTHPHTPGCGEGDGTPALCVSTHCGVEKWSQNHNNNTMERVQSPTDDVMVSVLYVKHRGCV